MLAGCTPETTSSHTMRPCSNTVRDSIALPPFTKVYTSYEEEKSYAVSNTVVSGSCLNCSRPTITCMHCTVTGHDDTGRQHGCRDKDCRLAHGPLCCTADHALTHGPYVFKMAFMKTYIITLSQANVHLAVVPGRLPISTC